MKIYPLLIAVLATCQLLFGCAQQPQEKPFSESDESTQDTLDNESTQLASELKPKTRSFASETLYALLAAELAGSRERFDIALSNYVQQAHKTRDPQVAARATHIARFLNAENAALDAALLWVDIAPDDSEAQLNAALALMQNGRLQEAFELSRKLQNRDQHTLFQNIAASAAESTDTQREKLLESYRELLEEHPDHQELLVGIGLLLQQQGKPEEALGFARRALDQKHDSTSAAILEANLLHQLGRENEALERITSSLEQQPRSLRLRLQYARLLTQHDLEKAQEQFERLVQEAPGDPDLKLSLGLVAMERGDIETAQENFEALLDSGQHVSRSHYYLGQLASQQQDSDQALLHYLQVQPGSDFLAATIEILNIFMARGDLESANQHMGRLRVRFPDQSEGLYLLQARSLVQHDYRNEAETLLSRALDSYPTSSDLLYARALLHDQNGQLQEAERDLRQILTYDPNNATALNALGYILADRNQRLDEAEQLISQALALEPEEPAILDSMGWVLYRQGKPREALNYLEQAMDAYPDQEIAAHLGEVLWVLGERERAREVWQQGLELDPESELIPTTMRRLEVGE